MSDVKKSSKKNKGAASPAPASPAPAAAAPAAAPASPKKEKKKEKKDIPRTDSGVSTPGSPRAGAASPPPPGEHAAKIKGRELNDHEKKAMKGREDLLLDLTRQLDQLMEQYNAMIGVDAPTGLTAPMDLIEHYEPGTAPISFTEHETMKGIHEKVGLIHGAPADSLDGVDQKCHFLYMNFCALTARALNHADNSVHTAMQELRALRKDIEAFKKKNPSIFDVKEGEGSFTTNSRAMILMDYEEERKERPGRQKKDMEDRVQMRLQHKLDQKEAGNPKWASSEPKPETLPPVALKVDSDWVPMGNLVFQFDWMK